MRVKLYKQEGTYKKDGVETPYTHFYLRCGGTNIPIKVSYQADKATGKDALYLQRKAVLRAFAEFE